MCKWRSGAVLALQGASAAAAAVYRERMELQANQPGAGADQRRAYTAYTQRKHVFAKPPRGAPKATMAPRTPLQRATALLWPHGIDDYPGPRYGLYHLFKGRAAIYTIRDWRRGKRRLPQWARDILVAELKKKAAAFEAAARELEQEARD